MKTIDVQGCELDSRVLIGESVKNLKNYLPEARVITIIDENVHEYYQGVLPSSNTIVIGTGERIKTVDTVSKIYEKLIDFGADRSSFILGFGGGIVCDIAGFAASTYMRGIRFGFVSTTLLSQVDASVGGKNGVNFMGYKNMVGVFNQPEFVICDPAMFATLPEEELKNGCAEIVKHAAISDKEMFAYLEKNTEEIFALNPEVLERLVFESIKIKADVVSRDEREKGERRKLNFGHTLGHAIEKTTGIPHGQAVSIGMVAAARLSEKKGFLSEEDRVRIEQLLEKLRLPTKIPAQGKGLYQAMAKDKKREGETVFFVLLKGLGNAVIEEICLEELKSVLE